MIKTSLRADSFKRFFFFPSCFSTPCADLFVCFSVLQVRGHGAKNNRGEGVWVHMLSEWGAGHRLAGPCHSVKLQPYLPPKPAGGEATSPEGTDSPPFFLRLPIPSFLSLSSLCFASIWLFFSVPVLSARNRMTGQTLSFQNINLLLCSLCMCVLGGLNLLECISVGERNKRGNDNDWTNDLQSMVSAAFQ